MARLVDLGTNRLMRSPHEAAKAFDSPPKQRHLFLVRFYKNGAAIDAQKQVSGSSLQAVTYVAKTVDRPKINTKTEELHQYNKKRQIYTGFKLEPVRVQLYDDHRCTAMSMIRNYMQYYFGDLNANSSGDYAYDVVANEFRSTTGNGFGFTAASTGNADFYFDMIEIYHFYGGKNNSNLWDCYQLKNPRISAYDPDDLDYGSSEVATISLTLVYEDLQYILAQKVSSGDSTGQHFEEFLAGATFDGDVMNVPSVGTTTDDSTPRRHPKPTAPSAPGRRVGFSPIFFGTDPTAAPGSLGFDPKFGNSGPAADFARLEAGAVGSVSAPQDYRYVNAPSTGPLNMYGNFTFGANSQADLTNMALNNLQLATALDIGMRVNPLTLTKLPVQAAVNSVIRRGLGAVHDLATGAARAAVTSAYINATNTMLNAYMASYAMTGTLPGATPYGYAYPEDQSNGYPVDPSNGYPVATSNGYDPAYMSNGAVLTPEGYGVLNSQQTGTAQYGYIDENDGQSDSDGSVLL